MLKKIIIILFLNAFVIQFTYAQHGNHWVFADELGLNFNFDPPKITSSSIQFHPTASSVSAAISDCSGELVFYATPCTLWNQNNEIVHYFNEPECAEYNEHSQTALIPIPGNDSLYYWFYFKNIIQHGSYTERDLYYSVINANKNDGKGDIVDTLSDILLEQDKRLRHIHPVFHENEEDIWLLSVQNNTTYFAYLITKNGVNTPVQSTGYMGPEWGTLVVSPSGEKVVSTNLSRRIITGVNDDIEIKLYDFNRQTGQVTNPQTILTVHDVDDPAGANIDYADVRGAAFSPNNEYLYINNRLPLSDGTITYGQNEWYQLNLNNLNITQLLSRHEQQFRCRGEMYLAPNGIIYNFCWGDSYIHTIEKPNLQGEDASFREKGIDFGPDVSITRSMSNMFTPSIDASFKVSDNCTYNTIFTNQTDTAEVDSVRWYFGDGDSADTWHTQHAFDSGGTYFVQMKAYTSQKGGCQGQIWRSASIEIKHPVHAGFTDTVTYQCGQATLIIEDTSLNSNEVQYDFGNGVFISQSSFVFHTSGTYYIRQAVESARGCRDTTGKYVTISISDEPEAAFDWNDQDSISCTPYALPVSNNSTQAEYYRWLVNNTELDSGTVPGEKITEAGTWNITLIAYNDQQCPHSLTKESVIITVNRPDPEIHYTKDTSCSAIDIDFAVNYNNAESFTWYFHDGTTSPFIEKGKTYKDSGSHPVELVVSNDHCTDTVTVLIHAAIEPSPESLFETPDTGGCTPHNIEMTNKTTGSYYYEWFVSGPEEHSSTSENPSFTFNETGRYNIMLISHNNQGCSDTLTKEGLIEVLPMVEAGLEAEDETGCEHVRFHFSNHSQNADRWHWDFGDGNTSDKEHPFNVYRDDGYFEIMLTASSAYCSDTAYTEEPIEIIPAPEPSFTLNNKKGCIPLETQVANTAEGDIIDLYYTTSLGDTAYNENPEFIFSTEDTILIHQHLESSTGCLPVDSKEVIAIQQPHADFAIKEIVKECGKENWHFIDQSDKNTESKWLLEENEIDFASEIEVVFKESGNYQLILEARRHFCVDTVNQTLDVNIRPKPEVNFYAPDTSACLPGDITFRNQSSNADVFTWDFGKGTKKLYDTLDVTNRYTQSGVYTIQLTAESEEGCSETLTRHYYINILDSVHADFEVSPQSGCMPLSISIDNLSRSEAEILNYNWSFGTGENSNEAEPDYVYENVSTGQYEIILTADNDVCSDTAKTTIEVSGYDGSEDGPEMEVATVVDDHIKVRWHRENDASRYVLFRGTENEMQRYLTTENTKITDKQTIPDELVYHYRVKAEDNCGNTSAPSRIGRNINLYGTTEANESALLQWNTYADWPEGVHEYVLQRREWEGDYVTIQSLNDTTFTDENYFRENGLGYCYRVNAHREQFETISYSNELCLPYPSELYVPNAFSPNKDGLNDVFEVVGTGIKDFEMRIFNRWGQELYFTDNINEGWDGIERDEPIKEGVYVYMIYAIGIDGILHIEEGSVLLIR